MLGDSNPVYYKTETIMLFSNYLSSKVGEKKNRGTVCFQRANCSPNKRRLGKKKNGINHIFPRQGGETPEGHSTLKNINELLILG